MSHEKLKRLLYRKAMCEQDMNVLVQGATVYTNYIDVLKARLAESPKMLAFTKAKLEKEIHENTWIARNFIQSFKETKREYEHHILPSVENITEELKVDKSDIQFIDCNKVVEDLVKTELYGKVTREPANVELLAILKDFDGLIKITKDLIAAIGVKLTTEEDAYEKAVLEKQLFVETCALMNLQKRRNVRFDYYHNQFLPRYKREMAECKKYLQKYLKRGEEFVAMNIDLKLRFLLDEYKTHKDEHEKLWLFYTALKTRVDQIIEFVAQNPDLNQGKMYLGQKIV